MNLEIISIYTSPAHNFRGHKKGEPGTNEITSVNEVECVAGKGIKGDRYFGFEENSKRQITFFDNAVYEHIKEKFDQPDLDSSIFRRNVITKGVDLNDLIGKEFTIQGIRFYGVEECRPCFWMDEVIVQGCEEELKGWGGLRAKILEDGKLRLGVSEIG